MRWRPGTEIGGSAIVLCHSIRNLVESNIRRLPPAGESSRRILLFPEMHFRSLFPLLISPLVIVAGGREVFLHLQFSARSLGGGGGGGLWDGGSPTTVRFLAAVAEAKFVGGGRGGGENDVLFLPPPARYLATPPHPTPVLEKKTKNRTHLSSDFEFKE